MMVRIDENGGGLGVIGKDGNTQALMYSDEHGGGVAELGNDGT